MTSSIMRCNEVAVLASSYINKISPMAGIMFVKDRGN